MDQQIAMVVGSERFLAWVLFLTIGMVWRTLAPNLKGTIFYTPMVGMEIEAYSMSLHQFSWWIYHMGKFSSYFNPEPYYNVFLIVAGVAYVGAATGAVLISRPFVEPKAGSRWWVYSTIGVLIIWCVGYGIAYMWIV